MPCGRPTGTERPRPDPTGLPRSCDPWDTLRVTVSEGDSGTGKWEPSHQRRSLWGRDAVCAASWTWSEPSARPGQDHRLAHVGVWIHGAGPQPHNAPLRG